MSELYQVTKRSNTLKWYTLKALLNKNWYFFSFFPSVMEKLHHGIFWDATLLALILHLSLFRCFAFFKSNMPSKNSYSIRIIFIKIIIKISIINTCTKNTHFITTNCDITRIFIKMEYRFISVKSIIKASFYLSQTDCECFNAAKELSTAS